MHSTVHKVNMNIEKFFWILSSILFLLAFLYAYLVGVTIFNVAARQHNQTAIRQLSSDTSDLEASYISLQNNITLPLAYSMGFKEVTNPQFLLRNTSSDFQGLSFNSVR